MLRVKKPSCRRYSSKWRCKARPFRKIISLLSKIEKLLKEGEEEDEGNKANYGQSELTQKDIDRVMTERKVRLLLPNLMPQFKSTPRPRNFKRTHVNDFSESRDTGSWEDHDWLEWSLKVGTT